ncbi:hypothetical protein CsatB_005146 [Cannabis sativa]|uniref:Uncharacterized protein n=1 Tax=Cannabis sativa TaxID=3483 RepID=A0A7J6GHY6_CANSA|nr:hypothetical protein G4B88_011410 [Cannabis sativa]
MEAAAIFKNFSGTDCSSPDSSPLNSISNPNSYYLSLDRFNSPEYMEMVGRRTGHSVVEYTSLKDLIQTSSYPAAVMSPTPSTIWNEIPIKNPLVKHAAMAYLQPMKIKPEIGSQGLNGKLKEKCGGAWGWGCLEGVCDVVLEALKDVLGFPIGEVEDDERETMSKFTENRGAFLEI